MKTVIINVLLFLLPGGLVFVALWNIYKHYKKKEVVNV